jgi:hypothetical protein
MSKPGEVQESFDKGFLLDVVNDAAKKAKAKLAQIKAAGDTINIGDMFDMQMAMNHLSQLSEMCSSVVNACNTSMSSMARNTKA